MTIAADQITAAEILAEIRRAAEAEFADPDGAMLSTEWARAWGICPEQARRRIGQAITLGYMELVRVRRRRMNGVSASMSAYRPTAGGTADA